MPAVSDLLIAALQQHQARDLAAAERLYRQVLQRAPDHPDALNLLGVICQQTGRREEAVELIVAAVRAKPDFPEGHYNLGKVFQEQGRLDEAVASYREAARLKPEMAAAHYNLGNALRDGGRLDEAAASYRQAIGAKPDYAKACTNLGNVLVRQRRPVEAVESLTAALRLQPRSAAAHSNLARALQQMGQLEQAVAHGRAALEIDPNDEEIHNNLGVVFQSLGRLDEAIACFQRALKLKPDYAESATNLGSALKDQGKLEEALACYRRALDSKPDFVAALNNLLFTLSYREGVTLEELAAAHAEYERRHAGPLRASWRPHPNHRDPDRRLRVGFVSADFGQHPVGYFSIRVLENLAPDECTTICYSNRIVPDEMTDRFRKAAGLWRDVAGLSDDLLAEQIRADEVDILFDLSGHTAGNRLPVFARKPAPIQISWLGYVGTTGLRAMDYLLADRYEVPGEAESRYCERVLRMPDGYVCFDPPADAPAVGPLPATVSGSVTFGSFNNPAKITPEVVRVWSDILRRQPGARLTLQYRGLDSNASAAHFRRLFAERGIEPERLRLAGESRLRELLAAYNRVDVALDTFPYNGGLTTCEALWMGVPVVTCAQQTFAGRHALGHLSVAGCTETIAGDLDEYRQIALSLAGDPERLAGPRASLRGRVSASPLCDGRRFAANLTSLLRDAWRAWIAPPGRAQNRGT